tara:strand:+ start:447 stop:842 length:396 start_codon:yes stop_codon:yes gene_type:complete
MFLEQSFGSSAKRYCAVWKFWATIAGFIQMLGLTLIFPHLAFGQQVEGSRFLLDNVRVIVGDGTVLESGALLIEDSRIAAVGSRLEIEPDSAVNVIDLSGKTIMPAMIDSHSHLVTRGTGLGVYKTIVVKT